MFHREQHLAHVIEFALAVSIRIKDTVVYYPKLLALGIEVYAWYHSDTLDNTLFVATLLGRRHLDARTEALDKYGVIEDEISLGIELQQRLNLLE